MNIEFNATFRNGALYPETPLNLPDNTSVHGWVAPRSIADAAATPIGAEETHRTPPQSPRITVEEFNALVEKYSISAPPLPEDFSRADIYSDHD